MEHEKIKELLGIMIAVKWLCLQMHYEANGTAFYALHLLADRIKDGMDGKMDALRESYFLGFNNKFPPHEWELADIAKKYCSGKDSATGDELIKNVWSVLDIGIHTIEDIKSSETVPCGVQNVLDDISHGFIVSKFLCSSSLTTGSK